MISPCVALILVQTGSDTFGAIQAAFIIKDRSNTGSK